MLETFDGQRPKLADSAFVHRSACVRGDVEIGDRSMVLPGASITGDCGTIRIGRCTIIEDNCVIHVGTHEEWERNIRSLLEIGDNVTIGHGAVVHGRSIGNRVLIGMNATILEAVQIGDECVIAAGAVVPQGMTVPDRSFVAGVPGKIKGELKPSQARWVWEGYEGNFSYYEEQIQKLRESVTIEPASIEK
jgi:carbonic anhydrase/acetyltransferase-like protein (isoleucine patch superfamily)